VTSRIGLSCTHTRTNKQVLISQYDCFSAYDEGVSKAVTPNKKVIQNGEFSQTWVVCCCKVRYYSIRLENWIELMKLVLSWLVFCPVLNPGRQTLHRNLRILNILILTFFQKSRPALGPAQSLIEWVPRGKTDLREECVELYFHSAMNLRGVHRENFAFYFTVRMWEISNILKYLRLEIGMLSMARFLHVGYFYVLVFLPDCSAISLLSLFLLFWCIYLRVKRFLEFYVWHLLLHVTNLRGVGQGGWSSVKGLVASEVDISRSQWSYVGLVTELQDIRCFFFYCFLRGVPVNEGNISSVLTSVSCKPKVCKCRRKYKISLCNNYLQVLWFELCIDFIFVFIAYFSLFLFKFSQINAEIAAIFKVPHSHFLPRPS